MPQKVVNNIVKKIEKLTSGENTTRNNKRLPTIQSEAKPPMQSELTKSLNRYINKVKQAKKSKVNQ